MYDNKNITTYIYIDCYGGRYVLLQYSYKMKTSVNQRIVKFRFQNFYVNYILIQILGLRL